MQGHRVVRSRLDGTAETVVEITQDDPSGLGWLPDGRLLVVAMETQKLSVSKRTARSPSTRPLGAGAARSTT
jgi:hypothetical protein